MNHRHWSTNLSASYYHYHRFWESKTVYQKLFSTTHLSFWVGVYLMLTTWHDINACNYIFSVHLNLHTYAISRKIMNISIHVLSTKYLKHTPMVNNKISSNFLITKAYETHVQYAQRVRVALASLSSLS